MQGNDNKENSIMRAAEDEVQTRMHAMRCGLPNVGENNMSSQERKDHFDRQELTATIEHMVGNYFDLVLKDCKTWMSLRWIAKYVACRYPFNTNVVMRCLVNDKDNGLHRREAIGEISKYLNYTITPVEYARFVGNDKTGGLPHNLTECYWLRHLCRYLGCADQQFEEVMAKALEIWVDPEELEFIEPLDSKKPRDQLIIARADEQYKVLEKLLRKL